VHHERVGNHERAGRLRRAEDEKVEGEEVDERPVEDGAVEGPRPLEGDDLSAREARHLFRRLRRLFVALDARLHRLEIEPDARRKEPVALLFVAAPSVVAEEQRVLLGPAQHVGVKWQVAPGLFDVELDEGARVRRLGRLFHQLHQLPAHRGQRAVGLLLRPGRLAGGPLVGAGAGPLVAAGAEARGRGERRQRGARAPPQNRHPRTSSRHGKWLLVA
jgi:hypothetical protein